ncbi:polymer-forming cytoskeletal protein [bacterium]|nr:polymer-forming cytoskeletal protein [bacterium]
MKKVLILFCFLMLSSVLLASEVFHIEQSTIIKEDLVLIGKSCVIDGTVRGDAVIINGNLELNGTVEGDAVVLGGEAIVNGQSHVKGDLVIVGGNLIKAEGAFVDGEVVIISLGPLKNLFKLIPSVVQFSTENGKITIEGDSIIKPFGQGTRQTHTRHTFGWKPSPILPSWILLVKGIALSMFIMIFTAIFSSGSETMALYLEKKPRQAFFAGFLAQILFVPAIIVLVFSIIGILFIPFLMLAYPIALLVALVPCSLFIGKKIVKESAFFNEKRSLISLIGLLILFIMLFLGQLLQIGSSALNIIGGSICFLTLFAFYLYFTFGLGCLILSRVGTRKP